MHLRLRQRGRRRVDEHARTGRTPFPAQFLNRRDGRASDESRNQKVIAAIHGRLGHPELGAVGQDLHAGAHHQAAQHDGRVAGAKWRHDVGHGHGRVVLHHDRRRVGALELASAAEFLAGADRLAERQGRVHAHPKRIEVEAGLQVGARASHQGNRRPVHHVADRDAPLAFAQRRLYDGRRQCLQLLDQHVHRGSIGDHTRRTARGLLSLDVHARGQRR